MAPLSSDSVSSQDYRRALAGLYGYYRPAEEWLFRQSPCLAQEIGIRRKYPALIQDLSALGLAAEGLALCHDVPELVSPPAQLGMLYVLEGATLGGQVIRKRLWRSFGEQTPEITHFHGFHGDGAGPWWRSFQQALSDRLDAEPSLTSEAVEAALVTFASLEAWLLRSAKVILI